MDVEQTLCIVMDVECVLADPLLLSKLLVSSHMPMIQIGVLCHQGWLPDPDLVCIGDVESNNRRPS